MNAYFVVAGCLAFVVGLIHSVLGELRIFRPIHERRLYSSTGSPILKERHVSILWVTWHLVTLFGWSFGAALLWMSSPAFASINLSFIEKAMTLTFSAASLLTLVGTRGKHLGWVGLLIIAILVWLG